ncbi:MAG: Dabb family protein [Planctomycetaceae bacterium]|nr:Dabb family protein [Planctomycetaceae bacterium]
MKRVACLLGSSVLLIALVILMPNSPARSATSQDGQVLRHVVLLKFKEDATDAKIQEVIQAFSELPKKITEIHGFEWGREDSVEKLNKGFTHCFLVTFKSEDDLKAYLPHPAHQDFVKVLGPALADVLVVDYWANH